LIPGYPSRHHTGYVYSAAKLSALLILAVVGSGKTILTPAIKKIYSQKPLIRKNAKTKAFIIYFFWAGGKVFQQKPESSCRL
jgi:hypothetical protein